MFASKSAHHVAMSDRTRRLASGMPICSELGDPCVICVAAVNASGVMCVDLLSDVSLNKVLGPGG